jgi:hypothetical protein
VKRGTIALLTPVLDGAAHGLQVWLIFDTAIL